MKKFVLLWLVILFVCQIAVALVSFEVYWPDGETPFFFFVIMAGQKLILEVTSDSNDLWSGAFFIEGDDRALASLQAGDSDPNTRDCDESHYSAAGDYAVVYKWVDSVIWGYDLYGSDVNCLPGDWYTLDYHAENAGQCQLDFYDYNADWDDPNLSPNFTHKPSCDFNQDGSVDYNDFSQLSAYWLTTDCNDVNDCIAVDLDFDGSVDQNDLTIFTEFWLWDGPNNVPPPSIMPDPNYIYSIIDINDLDEITLEVGQTVTLYIYLEVLNGDHLRSLEVEVHISDPNLGEIDNVEDPNGTAMIYAYPRSTIMDYWGPGIEQEDGIRFILGTLSFTNPINDGYLVGFEYTANNTGDVTLNLTNIVSLHFEGEVYSPTLESILIHQTAPEMQGGSAQSMMFIPELMIQSQSLPEINIGEKIDPDEPLNNNEMDEYLDYLLNL